LHFLLAGDYGIHVKFNDEHVPDSPATVHIVPVSADAKKITIAGLRDRGLEVSKNKIANCILTTSAVLLKRTRMHGIAMHLEKSHDFKKKLHCSEIF
jgi:hypothetical protein